jgi:CHAT domain-containing protein
MMLRFPAFAHVKLAPVAARTRMRVLPAFFLVVGCLGFPAGAQDTVDIRDAATEFQAAAAKHNRDLHDLIEVRGTADYVEDRGPVTIDRFAAELPRTPQLAVLLYSYDNGHLWSWLLSWRGLLAVTRQQVHQDSMSAVIDGLRLALRVPALQRDRAATQRGFEAALPQSDGPPLAEAIARATALLLPRPMVERLSGVRGLTIVPTLNIGTVPFAMLQPFGDESFLVDSIAHVIAPSLYDVLQDVTGWRRAGPASAVVVGNPAFAVNRKWSLPPLPGAEREARNVADIFGTSPLIGAAATIDAMREAVDMRRPKILYLATHGVADPASPLDGSFLAFAPNAEGRAEWTARDIQHTELRGISLAVLSACQTGLGSTHDAGVIGLTRGFQLAGVPRVMMTLWNVDDAATAEFMTEFSREILTELPVLALQATMIRMRQRYPDPIHWAPFVLFGSVH